MEEVSSEEETCVNSLDAGNLVAATPETAGAAATSHHAGDVIPPTAAPLVSAFSSMDVDLVWPSTPVTA